MSDLTFIERKNLEDIFQMGDGYVLDFTNQTISEFVDDSTGLWIYDAKYHYKTGSKANRLRAFWKLEPNHVVGKLINDMLEYACLLSDSSPSEQLLRKCKSIARRLQDSALVENLDVIAAEGNEGDFDVLSKAVRESINNNEPEAGLDRLHTFVTRLIRNLAEKRGIVIERSKPLQSIFGEYVKALRKSGLIESEMTMRIMTISISLMEALNKIRNEESLAHDNRTLNREESIFVFNQVCSLVRFVRDLEAKGNSAFIAPSQESDDDVG